MRPRVHMHVLVWVSCQCSRQVGALLGPGATILLCWPSPPRGAGPSFHCGDTFRGLATRAFTAAVQARVQSAGHSQVDLWPDGAGVDRWQTTQRVEGCGCRFIHI